MFKFKLLAMGIGLGLLSGCHSTGTNPQWQLPNKTIISGDPVHIKAVGLPPHQMVTVKAERIRSAQGLKKYCSEIIMKSDARGRIDLSKQSPVSGSYSGVDP